MQSENATLAQDIADGKITSRKIQDAAITTEKISDAAITAMKLAPESVAGENIQDEVVTSSKVRDGAIGMYKLDPALRPYLIPPGLIALFDQNCPEGWTRYAEMDNRFPLGANAAGDVGGARQHEHALAPDGKHSHLGATQEAEMIETRVGGPSPNPYAPELLFDVAVGNNKRFNRHRHWINEDGQHAHGGATSSVDVLPPYRSIIYCRKD